MTQVNPNPVPSRINSDGAEPAMDPNAYIESLTKTIFLLRDRLKLYAHDDLTVHALTVCIQNTRDEIRGIFESAPANMEFAREMMMEMPEEMRLQYLSALGTESVARVAALNSSFAEKIMAFGKPA